MPLPWLFQSSDLRDLPVRGVVREPLQVVLVHRCYGGPAQKISDCHHERVYCLFRSKSRASDELSSRQALSSVHRVHLDTQSA